MKSDLAAKPMRKDWPWPSPEPRSPPASEGEEGLGELAGALAAFDGGEGIQPVPDPAVHVRLQGADGVRAQGGQQQPDRDPADPAGGGEQHDDEEAEEEQRGPEVPLQNEHADAEQPDREDRAEDPAGQEAQLPEEPHGR